MPITFAQRGLIHAWTNQGYVQEWLHGEGLQWTLNDLDQFSQGSSFFQHWIAFDKEIPFAYLLTASAEYDSDDPFCRWCTQGAKTISLDVIIGNPSYLGKKISHKLIQQFLLSKFSDVDEVLIDPDVQNIRAIRAYQKAGFQPLGDFIPKNNPTPHLMMRLKMGLLKSRGFASDFL
jgi:RimJ/RimL family protein N-acetyltransferase